MPEAPVLAPMVVAPLLGRKLLRPGLPRSDLVGRWLFGRRLGTWPRLVQDDAIEHSELADPAVFRQCPHCVGVACLPAHADARGAEVDVPGVALIVEAGCEQPHHMHARLAAIAGELLYQRIPLL